MKWLKNLFHDERINWKYKPCFPFPCVIWDTFRLILLSIRKVEILHILMEQSTAGKKKLGFGLIQFDYWLLLFGQFSILVYLCDLYMLGLQYALLPCLVTKHTARHLTRIKSYIRKHNLLNIYSMINNWYAWKDTFIFSSCSEFEELFKNFVSFANVFYWSLRKGESKLYQKHWY